MYLETKGNLMVVARPAGVYSAIPIKPLVWLAGLKTAAQSRQSGNVLANISDRKQGCRPAPVLTNSEGIFAVALNQIPADSGYVYSTLATPGGVAA